MNVQFDTAIEALRRMQSVANPDRSADSSASAAVVVQWMNNARFALELWFWSLKHGTSGPDDVRAIIGNLIPEPKSESGRMLTAPTQL